MTELKHRLRLKQSTIIAASVHLIFCGAGAWANPTGPQVVNGAASFQHPNASTLNVTNAPGTIINWQGFSIGANEVTRFIQQSSSSAVLNRVVGADISQIQGQLLSNGRVFLINPSGIVIGPGAVVDTAGFVASTLNMLDGDFIAGKLKFEGNAGSGAIINQGWIRTGYGGQVILVAPHIENSGLIHTPGGELLLAAGQKLTIASLDIEGVQFEVQAPTDSVLNVGRLLADGGAVGVFAGTLKHSGDIRANSLVQDAAGRVILRGTQEVQIAPTGTVTADGKAGGQITIESAGGTTRVAGNVSARGSDGKGGDIQILGGNVSVAENAVVDASGSTGGGQVLVGGDFQGGNPDVQNAENVFVGQYAELRADATQSGDGGRIIVWSDDKAQFYGSLSARGGPQAGNGGFAEVSGKQKLIFAGGADLGAPKGGLGTLLLDPLDLFVFTGGGATPSITDEVGDFPSNVATVSPATLEAINGNVALYASRYMRISDPIDFSATPGKGLTAQVGVYTPPALPDPLALSTSTVFNELEIGANITTAGGAVSLIAPTIQSFGSSTISTGGGAIGLNSSGATISASGLSLDAGAGAVTATSGSFIQLGAITGGTIDLTSPSFISTGAIVTSNGPVNLTSSGSSISTGTIAAGSGNVTLSGVGGVFTSTIDTSGTVNLTASSGSISTSVNNASSLTANAAFSVFVNSSTDINVASVNAGDFSSASLSTSGGSILPVSAASEVKGMDVSLITGLGTDGGIGTAGTALNVDVARIFTFRPNGEFNVLLTGTGPNALAVQMGVASVGQNYSGTLSKSGGGLTMSASATDSTVTLANLAITSGFDNVVIGQNPSISFHVPNGALTATSVSVPAGSTSTFTPLGVTLSSTGNLALNSYTRASAAGDVSKQTTITSSGGTVTLGTVDANKDNVNVSASGDITVSSVMTTGNVTLNSTGGAVLAAATNAGLEVSAGGTLSITASGIGTANRLDLAGSQISLTSHGGGAIGGANPVVANTENLFIDVWNGSTFDVSTGSTALQNLSVSANPSTVGAGGTAQVATESGGPNARTYVFASDGTDFSLNIGTAPGTQFIGPFGGFTLNTTSGSINLIGNTSLAGNLSLFALGGSVTNGGNDVTASSMSILSNSGIDFDTGTLTATLGEVQLRSNGDIIAGDISAPQVTIGCWFCGPTPNITVGTITKGGLPGSLGDINITGSTVETGSVTWEGGGVNVAAQGGLLTIVGGSVTNVDGTINLTSSGGTPFEFTSIDAGDAGTVFINSPNGIRQSFLGGVGIRGQTIELLAPNSDIAASDSMGGANSPLDLLNGTNPFNLTLDVGDKALLDANGNTLAALNVTKRSGPDAAAFSLTGLGGGQAVLLGGGASDLEVEVASASPLSFELLYTTGDPIVLIGGGISTGGGSVFLSSGGGIDASSGGIATGGGSVTLQASGGQITTGAISTGGGSLFAQTFCVGCHIDVGGNLTMGAGSVTLAASDGNIAGTGAVSSTSSVFASTSNGTIGTSVTPLAISAPTVTLNANRSGSATGDEGTVWATLSGTSNLSLTGAYGFDVASNTPFTDLFVSTRGSGTQSVNLAATGQTFIFDRPGADLFGPVTNTFQIVSVGGTPITNATFSVSDGTLLVAGPTTINSTNLTLSSTGGADISLQGTAADPLSLSNATQTFSASGGAAADILIRGKVALSATGSQTFSASGNIHVSADDGVGGTGEISITAPTQLFITTGAASKMEFLGGPEAGEFVSVAATTQQQFFATTSFNSPDSLTLRGGSGSGSYVSFAHLGSGFQQVQINGGTVTVQGGSGENSKAEITTSSANEQQICRDIPFSGCVAVGTLNVLGGSGAGAYAQIVGSGAQQIGANSAFNVIAGTGNGAHALLQSGTGAFQNVFGGGNLTLEGKGGPGAVAKAEILATGFQSLSLGNTLIKAGDSAGSLARIATTDSQSISTGSLTLTAGGAGQTVEPFVAVPGAGAVIEGHNQNINVFGALTLNGGAGVTGNTADAVIRNLSGSQSIFVSSAATLNGGHTESTTGIINAGTGSQTVTANGGLLLQSDPNLSPAHVDAFVLIKNEAATLQTINASGGGITLLNTGDGGVAISSAGDQTMTTRFVDVSTGAGSTGNASIAATGNQRIHTTNGTFGPNGSMRVAALGTGTASIESSASQLLEIDYPESMQFLGEPGTLTVGDINAAGTSKISAVDQNIIAGSIIVQAGDVNSLSAIKASNDQKISTVLGGLDILGGSGANSLATIDPVSQTILVNGTVFLAGGSGGNADASIVSAGTQTIIATNGDVFLEGGPGSGADAFISGVTAPQTVLASGSVTLTPGVGSAFIGGPPAAASTTELIDTTSLLLPLQEDLTGAVSETTPEGTQEEELLRRRAPICR